MSSPTTKSKIASMEWLPRNANRPQKPRKERNTPKVLLVLFFDRHGLVYREFVQQHVNAQIYVQVLRNLHAAIRRRRRALWMARHQRPILLHHDNATPHHALWTQQFLQRVGMPQLPHPPYSLDLAPADFFMFPAIKKYLKGHRFQNLQAVQNACDWVIGQIPAQAYADAFHSWAEHALKCIRFNGAYFEGMH